MESIAKRTRADVPMQFMVPDMLHYPEDNFPDFEYWLYKNLQGDEIASDRLYLPVLFTAYYKRHSYGKDTAAIKSLQVFLNTLDTTKKYFTIVQFDDGILNDISRLDCKVFAMSGKPAFSEPIPLVCNPHKFSFPDAKKDILCSFVGRVTNPVRHNILGYLYDKEDYYVSDKPHTLEQYCNILARSVFVLCPRGYGANSFRVTESLQYGAIPIILQDLNDPLIFERTMPFICVDYDKHIDRELLMSIDTIMRNGKESRMPFWDDAVKNTYENYYTFPAVKKYILEKLSQE